MRPSAGLRSLATNGSYGAASKLLGMVLRLVYVLALARMLGAPDYGLYVYALSWYVIFMPLTNLGQELDLSRAIGGVALMALAVLPRALAVWTQTLFIVHERSVLVLRQDLTYRLLEVAVGIGILLLGADILAVALVHVLSWSLQAASGIWLVRRRFGRFDLRLRLSDWRARLDMGLRVGLSRLADGWLANGPVVLFRHLGDDLDELGVLAFCVQLLNLLRVMPMALSAAALPFLSRSLLRGDGKDARFIHGLGLFAALQAVAIALLLSIAGDRLVALALGPEFASASTNLVAVCWIAILPALGDGARKVLGLRGHYNRLLLSSTGAIAIMLVLAWPATVVFGIGGILFATAFGWLSSVLLLLARNERMQWGIGSMALGGFLAALIALSTGISPGDHKGFLLAGVCLAITSGGGLWLQRRRSGGST
jgi:O-antigen/teichoic acid export membrane protein